jgi:hypothetical protein
MGLILFWNRSEPFLLMMVAIGLILSERNASARFLPLALGMLAGAASAFKIHGIIYVFAIYILIHYTRRFSLESLVLFGVGAAIVFGLLYTVPGVSIWTFFDYVKIMGSQGLSARMLTGNAFYLALMAVPVWIAFREAKVESLAPRQILVLGCVAGLEVLVAIIAGKPGAGVHHLLPFIAVNAYIIGTVLELREAKDGNVVTFIYASMLVPAIIAMMMVISPMVKGWRTYGEAEKELVSESTTFPGLIAGPSDTKQFPYVYLRVLLKGPQPEYTAFMDLQYSGVTDDSFTTRMEKCEIKNIIVPKPGIPFSMTNVYTGKPLMSDHLRMVFKERYELVREGNYYDVYSCH